MRDTRLSISLHPASTLDQLFGHKLQFIDFMRTSSAVHTGVVHTSGYSSPTEFQIDRCRSFTEIRSQLSGNIRNFRISNKLVPARVLLDSVWYSVTLVELLWKSYASRVTSTSCPTRVTLYQNYSDRITYRYWLEYSHDIGLYPSALPTVSIGSCRQHQDLEATSSNNWKYFQRLSARLLLATFTRVLRLLVCRNFLQQSIEKARVIRLVFNTLCEFAHYGTVQLRSADVKPTN